MELIKGRPDNLVGRTEEELHSYDFIEKAGMEYYSIDHEPAYTIEVCEPIEKVMNTKICKNLFLCNRQKTAFYLLMMPGDKIFHTKELSAQIGSARLSFASAEDMQRLLHITPGSVSILGLMYDTENAVKLLVDEDLLKEDYIGCHPCINTSTLKLKTTEVFDILARELNHIPTMVKLSS